jgi:uncharacterized protein DUF5719
MSARVAPVVGAVALAAVVAAGTATRPGAARPGPTTAATRPVTSVRLVCPGLDGSAGAPVQITAADVSGLLDPAAASSGKVTFTALREGTNGAASAPVTLPLAPAAARTSSVRLPATVVSAVGVAAAHVVASQHALVPDGPLRSLLSAPCLAPAADTWITGADGRVGHSDTLVLANPGTVAAAVTVTAWSVTGPVDLPGLQSYSVPPGHSAVLDVADYAPDAGFLSLHIRADVGRVAAQVRDNQSVGLSTTGTDWLPPTEAPAGHLVVPGYLPGAGPRLLVVTNPGSEDATVHLRLIAGDRAFVPAGHPDVVVPPGRSSLVDLSTSLGGVAAAAELTADRPVVAAGMSRVTGSTGLPDLAWHPAEPALDGPAAFAENGSALGAGGMLALTAVGSPATVRLVAAAGASRTVEVAADRTVTVDLRTWLGVGATGPIAVVPMTGAVWATRSLTATGAHGPLVTSVAATPLPPPIRLPPAVEDLRVAVR